MGIAAGVLRKATLESFNVGDIHEITTYLNDEAQPDVSIVEVNRIGEKKDEAARFNIFYYVVEGEGDFMLEGKTHHLTPGDMLVVTPGTNYNTPKGVKLLAISNPRFE